ncbi:MAG: lipopolysaccharide assembly LapA domain-containing protein [Desulfuromonadaceae bacterium]
MKFVKMFLALVGLAVLFVFVRDNPDKVTVEFWTYKTPEIELFLVLIITFVLGMIVASFGSTLKIIKLKRQLKHAGTGSAEQAKESRKDKKNKQKKNETDEVEPSTPSSSAGNYAATGSTAAGTAYTPDSTTTPTTETATAEADSAAKQPVKDQEDELLADAALDTDSESPSEGIETDEVIALPADEVETKEEDRK